jgi:hypothetical protein
VRERLVGVIVQAPAQDVPVLARRLARRGRHVTFTDRALDPSSIAAVRGLGDEVVPELSSSEASRWLSTRKVLRREARALGLPRRFFYLAPHDGATLGQYALARSVGGSPVLGARRLQAGPSAGEAPGDPPLRAGEIVVVSTPSSDDAASLERHLERIERERLAPVPLGRLAAAAGAAPGTAPERPR